MTVHGAAPAPARAQDRAASLRGLGPLGLAAIVVILAGSVLGPPVSAVLILVWAALSHTPWRELGFVTPRTWGVTVATSVVLGAVFKLVMKAAVMPLLGAPAVNEHYHYLAHNVAALPVIVPAVLLSAGVGEEIFFRGYLFERLGKLLGRGRVALTATVLLTATLFAVAHYQTQGLPGVEQAAATGLAFGGVYAWRKQIWGVMIAHAAFDLVAVALIYFSWETAVAHLLFR